MGEAVEESEGPRREFWTLLAKEIQSCLFEGDVNNCVLRHDAIGLQLSMLSKIFLHEHYELHVHRLTSSFVLANSWL